MSMTRLQRRSVFAPLFIVGVAVSPFAVETEETERNRRQRAGLTGVVGHWTAVDDGGAALAVDGAKWSGKSNADSLSATARRLFGAAAPDFVKNNIGDGSFPIAVHEPTATFANGTLRVRFKMVAGASDQNGGIAFGMKPDGSYLYVRYNTKDGDVALWRYVNGAREVITHGDKHAKLPLGAWQELVVTVNGTSVKGWVTGHDSVRVEHTLDAARSGRVGLWVKRDAVTTFKDYRVEPAR
jgi:hypothetical protein